MKIAVFEGKRGTGMAITAVALSWKLAQHFKGKPIINVRQSLGEPYAMFTEDELTKAIRGAK